MREVFFKYAAVLAITSATFNFVAYADDSRCNTPPYGSSVSKFQAFVKNFGHIVVPTNVLPSICKAKFGGVPRTGLYNLGITDEQIDREDTIDLTVEMLTAAKNLADKIN